MPLLHPIDRLPITVESLKTSKLGKIVMKLVKDPPTPGESLSFFVVRRGPLFGHLAFSVRCAFFLFMCCTCLCPVVVRPRCRWCS
ncbi:hypothetical protein K438DRAFT_1885811 [Mycena galopus ATCC 62051]|nr:hypothetical protein K438DRAFT_1885811 [Mycena galopus ATCC 62051]